MNTPKPVVINNSSVEQEFESIKLLHGVEFATMVDTITSLQNMAGIVMEAARCLQQNKLIDDSGVDAIHDSFARNAANITTTVRALLVRLEPRCLSAGWLDEAMAYANELREKAIKQLQPNTEG